MALLVNGEGVLLSDYQAELARLQQAQTTLGEESTPEEQKQLVLDNYVDQLLLAQAATQGGFSVDDATLQARIDKLIESIGGPSELANWQSANGYSDESFRSALRREIMSAWQRDQIINAVPLTAEQVHARQILVQEEVNANNVIATLESGVDFTELAKKYDHVLGGDLGWFAAGTLTQPDVDAAAFALQPGETSAVIHSQIGYHILYIIERESDHPLSVDGRRILQEKALSQWLADGRAASSIEILVP
jgi:peptidyl-prolyl cis-trans isomerase C